MKKIILTEEQIQQLKTLLKQNLTYEQISKIMNLNKFMIMHWTYKIGIKKLNPAAIWSEKELRILEEKRKEGYSYKKLSTILNKTIKQIFTKAHSMGFKNPKIKRYNHEIKKQIINLTNSGFNQREIPDKLKIPINSVASIRRSKNLKAPQRKWTEYDIKEICLMLDNNKSMEEISEITKRTIQAIIKRFGDLGLRKKYRHIFNPILNKYRSEKMTLDSFITTRLANAKKGAKKHNVIFNITREEIKELLEKQNYKCYYTHYNMEFKRNSLYSMSLDRIYEKGNYTKENTVLCCWMINEMRSDFSQKEFIKLCNDISKNHKISESS